MKTLLIYIYNFFSWLFILAWGKFIDLLTEVKRFIPRKHEDKVPHMGWNTLTNVKSGLFNERLENKFVYFVHSYYVPVNEYTAATTDYILPFSAALHKDNFYATQFHPEKSGSVGEVILKNFLKI